MAPAMLPLSFCLNQFSLCIWVRPSQRIDSKAISAAAVVKSSGNGEKQAAVLGRRIMVVVDLSREAKAALQWALSHTVQSQDTIVLVDVIKSSSFKSGDRSAKEKDPKSYACLYAMKKFCQGRRPEVEVEVEVSLVDGKDQRGPAIVAEAKRQGSLPPGPRSKEAVNDVAVADDVAWPPERWRRRRRGGGLLHPEC